DYERAYDMCLEWMKNYPAKTNKWGPFFEDVPRWSDTQINAVTYAMFLMDNPDADPNWKETVNNIFKWVHDELDNKQYVQYGVLPTDEQTAYRQPGNSHSARQASMELRYWEKTGDTTYVRNAVRQLNWATYMVDHDGKNFYPTNAIWMTDGYGDYVRHYLRAMASATELAPGNADHQLRSSSIVQKVVYQPKHITYTVFDSESDDLLRLTFKPRSITVDGEALKETHDLSAPGWSWQPLNKGGILTVRQRLGKRVEIEG